MSRRLMTDPTALSAAAAAEAIRDGEITSEALVRACLGRIAEREDEVRAWVHLDPELALAQARAADAAQRSGRPIGPLHGVPIGIKDIFDTADLPTEHGSPAFAGRRAGKDAASVAALRAAGAVIMGKTVTTELALLTPSKTRNPHNAVHTPGGSSAGSAAAVAAGMVPAAIGSQTAGSIIRPASFCGIFGFKPTLGLIPRGGVLMQSHTLDTVGVYGRSIDDLALLTDCMSAFDPDDSVSIARGARSLLGASREAPPAEPSFAFVKTPAWGDVDPRARAAFAGLVERLGNRIREVEIPLLADVIEWARVVQLIENAKYYGPLLADAPHHLSAGLRQRLEAGAKVAEADYQRALGAREPAYRDIAAVLDGCSAILTPSALGPAPASLESTGSPIMNGLWTYLGMPAVSLPLLEADGMPIGVQLVGARREDGTLLRTARWLTQALSKA